MGRKQPPEPHKLIPKDTSDIITQTREYELITPLFGGGAVPGEADEDLPIRGTEIRGQLRFWWRACRGGLTKKNQKERNIRSNEQILADMLARENAIWGAATKHKEEIHKQEQGEVQRRLNTVYLSIEVLNENRGEPINAYIVRETRGGNGKRKFVPYPIRDIPGYASFPLQPSQKELQTALTPHDVPLKEVRKGIIFTLTISYHKDYKEDVEAALWAWETFGGVGARTRRGFGALRCLSINGDPELVNLAPSQSDQVIGWLNERLKDHVIVGTWPSHVPYLPKEFGEGTDIVIFKTSTSGEENKALYEIWNRLIQGLKDFRQSKRRQESVWPETHFINYLKNNPTSPTDYKGLKKFPKAQFGLPIVFPLHNNKHPNNIKRKDSQLHLQPNTHERFSSPIILKPIACESGCYKGFALLLKGSRLERGSLILHLIEEQTKEKKEIGTFETYLAEPEQVLISSGHSFSIVTDKGKNTLRAFMEFMSKRR
ncbi:type III-B CRISPR module RAMP protein Cmr1 [Ktedonospora formicarum]|uniref:Type III-B CRISPR module RAMP protein Cmr1 n=1 Tax=Ktedonospora formicarum TaxID=2778364 RepID=A0A8J3MX63_9CHLR|nr:type III-B CRISPR module RAMP protein Cmr1 [Ktedonospora formicarum]GHO49661.1 type III-B CRISPR module RAMP protein Cmr1 [Ktedonospora formicarum]